MRSRRAVLSTVGLGVAALAGCLALDEDEPESADGQRSGGGSNDGGDGDDGEDGGDAEDGGDGDDAARALDSLPAPLGDPDLTGLIDTDVGALRSTGGSLTEYPDPLGQSAEDFDEEVEGVSPDDVDRLTVSTAFADDEDDGFADVAAVLRGSVDVAAVGDWLESETSDERTATGTHRGFEWSAFDEGELVVVAVGEGTVAVRLVENRSPPPAGVSEATIDAAIDGGDRLAAGDGDLEEMATGVAGHTTLGAVAVDPSLFGEDAEPGIDGLTAANVGTTAESRTERSVEGAARYTDPEYADTAALRDLLEREFENLSAEGEPLTDGLAFESDGRDLRVEGTLGEGDLSGEGLALLTFPMVVYVGSFGTDEPEHVPPQVAWAFERRDDGRVEVVHQGGDVVERVVVQYVTDGERRRTEWMPEDGIRAGDTFVTEEPVDGGTTLRVVWESPDGETSTILGEYTAP